MWIMFKLIIHTSRKFKVKHIRMAPHYSLDLFQILEDAKSELRVAIAFKSGMFRLWSGESLSVCYGAHFVL